MTKSPTSLVITILVYSVLLPMVRGQSCGDACSLSCGQRSAGQCGCCTPGIWYGCSGSCGCSGAGCSNGYVSGCNCPTPPPPPLALACTGNSTSAYFPAVITDCKCLAGFSGDASAPGGECAACPAGKYKDTVDNAECTACTGNSNSASEGSYSIKNCECIAGFSGNADETDGVCTPCEPGN
jgi:hypothetical protein